jgi:hypothetical protein
MSLELAGARREEYVPTTIRCASLDDPGFDGALARVLGRALDRAASLLSDADAAELDTVMLDAGASTPRAQTSCGCGSSGSSRSSRRSTCLTCARRFPGTMIGFEVQAPDVAGAFRRFHIVAYENVSDPAGGGRVARRPIFRLEFKDVLPTSIGTDVRGQFVTDLILDFEQRVRVGGPDARPPYAGFGWRFGRAKLLGEAMRRLNTTDPANPRINAELRNVVRDRLRASFDSPSFDSRRLQARIPAAEIARYRAELDHSLSFVEFF